MRILVTGGRAYRDSNRIDQVLSEVFGLNDCLIQGGASGADGLAYLWASRRGIAVCTFLANWDQYGPAAGPIRNGWMIEHAQPDLVIAFPGGDGTADCVQRAREAGVEVRLVD